MSARFRRSAQADGRRFDFAAVPFPARNPSAERGAPLCVLSLLPCGSMRYRYAEENPNRTAFLNALESEFNVRAVPLELGHTRVVYDVRSEADFPSAGCMVGDGIITDDRRLMPVVTVADCVPVFLYEPRRAVFGIVHSGWKGTGIAADAVRLAVREYGARADCFHAVIGPSIRQCCYIVDEGRARHFAAEFPPDCVQPYTGGSQWNKDCGGGLYRLSLQGANAALLRECGVPPEHIAIAKECTACDTRNLLGSFRRQTAGVQGAPFSVMAAAIVWR